MNIFKTLWKSEKYGELKGKEKIEGKKMLEKGRKKNRMNEKSVFLFLPIKPVQRIQIYISINLKILFKQ